MTLINQDIERIRWFVTYRLCGELAKQEAAELEAYLSAHPEFQEEVTRLEAAWQALDLLDDIKPPSERDMEVLKLGIFDRLIGGKRLSDAELEMLAAAGTQKPDCSLGKT